MEYNINLIASPRDQKQLERLLNTLGIVGLKEAFYSICMDKSKEAKKTQKRMEIEDKVWQEQADAFKALENFSDY